MKKNLKILNTSTFSKTQFLENSWGQLNHTNNRARYKNSNHYELSFYPYVSIESCISL